MHTSVKRNGDILEVELANTSDVVAFFVRMAVKDADGEMAVPVFWSDNRISLKPGETGIFTCDISGCPSDAAVLEVSGWNVPAKTVSLQ